MERPMERRMSSRGPGSKGSTYASEGQDTPKAALLPKTAVVKKVKVDAAKSRLPSKEPEVVKISLFPWSAAVCCALSVISAVATLAVPWSISLTKPSMPPIDLSWHARSAMMLIIQSMMLEFFILIASYTAVGIASDDLKPKEQSSLKLSKTDTMSKQADLAQHNLGDSLIIIGEYVLKFFTAWHFMYPEGVVSYLAPLSPDTTRVVYPVRHLQWSLAVPLLVLISNRSFLSGLCTDVQVVLRSGPALLLTMIYCIASLAMEVTGSIYARNFLIFLVLIDFIAVSVDQVVVACQVPNATSRGVKLSMLSYQIFTFTVYAGLYFAAYFGFVGSTREQSLYTYMDASVKVLHGCFLAMLRNREDIRVIRLWWLESVAARQDFERLVDQARVPIFGMDLQGRVTSWNGSLAQITGLAADAVEGTPVLQLLHKECHKSFSEAQALAAAATPSNCNAMEMFFRKNPWAEQDIAKVESKQNCAVVVISVVKKLSRKGAVEGYVGIGQDISQLCDMKAVEQKKTQLMAVVSHELRSPLHGMIGLTTAMEGAVPDEKVKKQICMVRSCANRLLDLVTNIMDITESEQQQRKGLGARDKKTTVDFLAVSEEVTVMTMMAVDKAGKPLVCPEVQLRNLMPELERFPVVIGNPYKLTQLLYNLMTNACKFTKKGSVTLRAKHVKEASTLEISVQDTGAGISKDSLERIFKPFEQDHGSSADARSFQGMGLGLAVCKEAVRLHDGSISVSSELGQGSTFTVSLPCQDTYVQRRGGSISQAMADDRAKKSAEPDGEGNAGDAMGKTFSERIGPMVSDKHSRSDTRAKTLDPLMVRRTSSVSTVAKTMGQLPSVGSKKEPVESSPLVLSVDDDEVNQEVVRNALSQDCQIHSAMDGRQALDFLEECLNEGKQFPDVILLDIQMPGLTGYDVLAEVRSKYTREHIKLPVIMASAKTPVESTALKSYAEGCTDFLPKPFHTDVLKAKVMVALEIKREVLESQKEVAMLDTAAKASKATAQAEASKWEEAAKTSQEKLDKAEQEADVARKHEASALKKAADAEARARSEGSRAEKAEGEVASLRKEMEQMRLEMQKMRQAQQAQAQQAPPISLPQHSISNSRAEKAESELAELRQELQRVRLAAAAATPSPPTMSPATNFTSPSPGMPLSPKAPEVALRSFAQYQPTASPLGSGASPTLYQRLAECEQEIMTLRGRLATEASARSLAVRQLDHVIWAAAHSKDLMLAETQS